MGHPRVLDASNAILVVVDVQEAFRKAIPEHALITSRIAMAVRGFRILEIPVVVTEQYPKGLGRTVEELMLTLPDDFEPIEKSTFSAFGDSAFVDVLDTAERKQIVICGVEAHVCVNQTAHDLLHNGYEVHLLTDCVASRFEADKNAGIQKMIASGAVPSSVEMALFEAMRDSKHEKFREVQAQIK
jgi:nicotinamidase-related amidase